MTADAGNGPAAMRVGIAGLAGRMGRLLAEEVATAGLTLAGGTIRPGSVHDLPARMRVLPDIAALAAACDIVIDFTLAETVRGHAQALAASGTPWVIGASGLDAGDEEAVLRATGSIPVMYAPNYAPGVTLMLSLAERMAAALPAEQYDAEILEMHHRHKRDSPSGTSLGLGRAVAAGRGQDLLDVMESGRHGDGRRRAGAIGFASLRGGEVTGEHTVLFASATEHLSLKHRAFDRRAYAAGAVRAACWLRGQPPGLYSMKNVLGLA